MARPHAMYIYNPTSIISYISSTLSALTASIIALLSHWDLTHVFILNFAYQINFARILDIGIVGLFSAIVGALAPHIVKLIGKLIYKVFKKNIDRFNNWLNS
jgi:hypothetical protein